MTNVRHSLLSGIWFRFDSP